MEVIRSREYYRQLDDEMNIAHKQMNYHIKQAETYKRIYRLTKNRRGVYRLLNKWARKMNQIHCEKGTRLGQQYMNWCLVELAWLTNYIAQQEEES